MYFTLLHLESSRQHLHSFSSSFRASKLTRAKSTEALKQSDQGVEHPIGVFPIACQSISIKSNKLHLSAARTAVIVYFVRRCRTQSVPSLLKKRLHSKTQSLYILSPVAPPHSRLTYHGTGQATCNSPPNLQNPNVLLTNHSSAHGGFTASLIMAAARTYFATTHLFNLQLSLPSPLRTSKTIHQRAQPWLKLLYHPSRAGRPGHGKDACGT